MTPKRGLGVPRELLLDGLSPADLPLVAEGVSNTERKKMPSPMPSMQEAVRIMMWALLGYGVSQGWLQEGLVPALGTIALAGIAAMWRYMAGSEMFPSVK